MGAPFRYPTEVEEEFPAPLVFLNPAEEGEDDPLTIIASALAALRHPLGILRTMPEWIEDGLRDISDPSRANLAGLDSVRTQATGIGNSLEKLSAYTSLIRHRTSYSRVDTGSALRLLSAQMGVEFPIRPDMPVIETDPILFACICRALLDNAVRHGGGVRRIAVRGGDRAFTFEVRDEGPGIQSGTERRLFLPQEQGTSYSHGRGLGFACVRRAAALLGAEIGFGAGIRNNGLCVSVTVPLR